MESLISNKSNRILKILNYVLIEKQNIYITDVMSLNKCSKKTAYNDLDEIRIKFNLNLYNYDYDDADNEMNVYQFIKFKNELLREETSIKLLLELYRKPFQDILSLAIAVNRSESHTRTQMLNLKKFLNDYKISLEKNVHSEYYLVGENKYTLAMFFSEIFKIIAYDMFMDGSIPFVRRSVFKNLSYHERELKMIESVYEEFENKEDDEQIINYFLPFKNVLDAHLRKHSQEINNFIKKHKFYITEVQREKVREIISIVYIKKLLQPKRLNYMLNRYDYFYLDAKRQKAELVTKFDDFCNLILKNDFDIAPYKTELFFHLYSVLDLYDRVDRKRIAVFSDMGFDHVTSLSNELKMYFSFHQIERYCDEYSYDLIVSTCGLDQKNIACPVIYIDDYINPLDIQQIYSAIMDLNKKS